MPNLKYDPEDIQHIIEDECDHVKDLLLTKNKEYGNAFAHPIKIFSCLDAESQINVRIDDKLNRIMTIRSFNELKVHEDTELDLIGYLILKRVLRRLNDDK